jgi:hypothetical protein
MLVFHIAYKVVVFALKLWFLKPGRPLGRVVLVPVAGMWLRRAAESGRLGYFASKFLGRA